MIKNKKTIELKNKKAFFNYEIIDVYEAGIQLVGTEVKSIRASNVSFTDSYCIFLNSEKKELIVKNLHIDLYENTSYNGHEPKRDRKLLLTKKELKKLHDNVKIKGLTIVPLKIYFKDSWVKIQIGLVKGKKQFDKRYSLKEKDLKREQERVLN